jgi:hypothetical protein
VRDIEVRLRGAGCNNVLKQTTPAHPLSHSGGNERCTGRETRRRKIG